MSIHEEVQEYYGKTLQQSDDLQTNACCTGASMPQTIKSVIADIHDEVVGRYYGCGLVVPELLSGCSVLDLGSGAGRDVYIMSKLVGAQGNVVGVDMTDEQLAVANRHIGYHQQKFGYDQPNVVFHKGYIEKLDELGLQDNSFDVVVSNCVINLCEDKAAVLREVYRVLKPGGELYFSDVYADRRVPQDLVEDPILYGECLSGALYTNDFRRLAQQAGFQDARQVEIAPITVDNSELEQKIGNIRFYSITYRLFKIAELEDACEDFGQAVRYSGTVVDCEKEFLLDKGHRFETGRIYTVCGNTYRMLQETRFAPHFEFFGNWDTHFGLYAENTNSSSSSVSVPKDGSDKVAEISFNDISDEPCSGGGCC